jgi:hypothetical protein
VFLTRQELETLTGFSRKASQIVQLRRMGIPFFVNGSGHPIVTRAAVEGQREHSHPMTWSPTVLQSSYADHEVLCGTSTNH